jgi:hypothetical protein
MEGIFRSKTVPFLRAILDPAANNAFPLSVVICSYTYKGASAQELTKICYMLNNGRNTSIVECLLCTGCWVTEPGVQLYMLDTGERLECKMGECVGDGEGLGRTGWINEKRQGTKGGREGKKA